MVRIGTRVLGRFGRLRKLLPGKPLSLLLVWLLALQMVQLSVGSDALATSNPMDGEGTEEEPYLIENAVDLDYVRHLPDAYFRLNAPITLMGNWTPIDSFTGHFDGNGHTISGMRIYVDFMSDPGEDIGMFRSLEGGGIKDLTLDDVEVTYNSFNDVAVGALAGTATNAEISNVQVTGGSVTGTIIAGGLVGKGFDGLIVRGSSAAADVQVTGLVQAAGGLIGLLEDGDVYTGSATGSVTATLGGYNIGGLIGVADGAHIENSSASGNVKGVEALGGLIGYAAGSTITSGRATGEVGDKDSWSPAIGGLIGKAESGTEVRYSYAGGKVYGVSKAGGLIGHADGITVENSYAGGRINEEFGLNMDIGGLIGYAANSAVSNSYATGDATGSFNIGGLIGSAESSSVTASYAAGAVAGNFELGGLIGASSSSTVTNSYYDRTKTGQSDDDGRGKPKTTADFGQEADYTGWDFAEQWNMDGRFDYPTLRAFDELKPAVKSASVENEQPDQVVITFYERIEAETDDLDALQVLVDDSPAAATGIELNFSRQLILTLAEPLTSRHTIQVQYDAAHPIADFSGNVMDSTVLAVDNNVLPTLQVIDRSPARGELNAAVDASLELTFSDPVSAAAGKTIVIRRLIDGRAVEQIAADDAERVSIRDAAVTIDPDYDFTYSTGYYVEIDPGAFEDGEQTGFPGIVGSSAWRFVTQADESRAWFNAGNPDFTGGSIEAPSLSVYQGELYAAYKDEANGGKAAVMKLGVNSSDWEAVGSAGFSAGEIDAPSLYIDNGTLYIAYVDRAHAGQATVMTYDAGTNEWTAVGDPGFTDRPIDAPSLFVYEGTPYLAFEDILDPSDTLFSKRISVMQYGGGGWATLGDPAISEDTAYSPSLFVHSGVPYVVFQDYRYEVGFGATAMKYDQVHDEWVAVGSPGFTEGLAFNTSLFISNGQLFTAYQDEIYKPVVMTFVENSGEWELVGAAGFAADQSYELSLFVEDGVPYVAYRDMENANKLTVMKYNGASWGAVGSAGFTPGSSFEPSLFVADGIPYVAYMERKNHSFHAAVMQYAPLPDPAVTAYSPQNGAEHVPVDANLALTFNVSVSAVSGKNIRVRQSADDVLVETIAADRADRVKITGTSVTIELAEQLDYGTGYYMEIDPGAFRNAKNGDFAGIAGSTVWSFTTEEALPTPPAPPTGLTATPGDQRVTLLWNAVPGAAGYNVYMGTVSGSYGGSPAVTVTEATYAVDGLSNGTTYHFAVTAVNDIGESDYSGEASAMPQGAPPSGNADLDALSLSAVALTPAFDSDTLLYSATVPYGVRSITVTASVYDSAAVLRVNGQIVADGHPFGPMALSIGTNSILVEVTAQDLQTRKTYRVEVRRLSDSGGDSPSEDDGAQDGEEDRDNDEPENAPDSGLKVIVNGRELDRIATGSLTEGAGSARLDVAVDTALLQAQLEAEGNEAIVLIPVTQSVDTVSVSLSGAAIRAMEDKQAVLVVQTPLGSYRLPAADIALRTWAERFGAETAPDALMLRVDIAKSGAGTVQELERLAAADGFVLAAPPIDFTVTVSDGTRTMEIARFGSYIEREIALPEGVDPGRITTAITYDPNGSVRHVPTYVAVRGGKYAAVINSLTNSTYALIWNEAAFADVEGHWAKPSVNDAASRMIVNGAEEGRFLPDASITRAEFAAILIRALGLPKNEAGGEFRDVRAGDWYAGAAAKAAEYGIAAGYADGTFRPERTIVREEAMAMIARALKLADKRAGSATGDAASTLSGFADGGTVSGWARQAAAELIARGVVVGSPAGLRPGDEVTRAEAAAMILRMLEKAGLIAAG